MDDLDLIKQKINIVDLIQEYLPLKKTGVNFKANCPFHQEKTPSFVVSPERQIFHCFGCNIGGDIFKFLMEKEGLDFSEALDILAKKAGITIKRQGSAQKSKKARLVEVNQKAAQFFHYLLTEHKLGERALDYLQKRGMNSETIKLFNLGYAPNSWESLAKFLQTRNFTKEEVTDAGLVIPSARGGYDRFRGRVIFPLIDVKSQILGFSGRILDQGEPKYINTSQTLIFDKGNMLFGLNLAKSEIRSKNAAVLVEGEMDMIMSYQAGVKNVVATKGTALTAGQLELLKKYTDNLFLCFDTDLAGDSASRRGIEMADAAGFNLKVIKLAEGKDPAEVVVKDPGLWEKAVEEAEPIYDYYLRSAARRYNSGSAEGKRRIGAELLPIWEKISDPLTSEHYLQKLAALLSTSEEILRKEMEKNKIGTTRFEAAMKEDKAYVKALPVSRQQLLEEYLLALLLKIPSSLTFVPNFPETLFSSENYRTVYVLLVLYLDRISFKAASFCIAEFVKDLPEDLLPIVDRLYLMEIDGKLENSKAWQDEIKVVVVQLKRALVKASLEKLSAEIKSAQVFGKIERLEILNKKFRDLSLKLKNLRSEERRVGKECRSRWSPYH